MASNPNFAHVVYRTSHLTAMRERACWTVTPR